MPERRGTSFRSPSAGEATLSVASRFDILKNARRRHVLEYLREHGGPVETGDLSTYVAAREAGIDATELCSQERKRVYVALHQCHLPRLEEAGVVSLDTDDGIVADETAAPQLYRYLPPYSPPPDRWYRYYLCAVAGGAVSLGGSLLVGGANGGSTRVVVGVFVTVLLACSIAHVLAASGRIGRERNPLGTRSRRSGV